MKRTKVIFILLLAVISHFAHAQYITANVNGVDLIDAIKNDDSTQLAQAITKGNVNNCYGNYSLLSQAVRANAKKCFDLLIEKGVNVNQVCNGYVPPLMHAAKYGRLDMVKILVAKGADINYQYSGDYQDADGETPLTYAEKFQHNDVADYLKSLQKNK